jgi:hypothetical protein
MKLFYALLSAIFIVFISPAQENPELSIHGGRVYFEMTTGSQQYAPSAPSQWSFRIGAGGNAIIGNFYVSGRYSITGIRHFNDEDFPQSLISYLRFGGGWVFQDKHAGWTITPILSAGHTSDRIMPRTGITELQFDGWGITPGIEARYVVFSSYDPDVHNRSSVFWATHFVQLEAHRILSERSYTVASISYHIVFDGYQLTINTEYNTLDHGARGWVVGVEFGFSWFRYRVR